MTARARVLALVAALVGGLVLAFAAHGADKTHRLAIQVDQNDPAVMNLVLNNVANVMAYY